MMELLLYSLVPLLGAGHISISTHPICFALFRLTTSFSKRLIFVVIIKQLPNANQFLLTMVQNIYLFEM
jgi:hypothetical protein